MPDDQPSLHVDTDWKKQAQEEKRRLAEQEAQRQADLAAERAANPTTRTVPMDPALAAAESAAAPSSTPKSRPAGSAREMPAANFGSLTQSLLTQILIYLGDVSLRGSEPVINLDMAKHLIDTLGVLEDKTKGNLTPEEQKLIDRALYESRMRYVAVAAQFVNP